MTYIDDEYARARHRQPTDETPGSGPITIKLVWTNVFTRWSCTVCGGCTEKVGVLAEGKDDHGTIRVCERCLEAGDIDARLERHAAEQEAQAALALALIGRLKVPSFDEWLAEIDRNNAWHSGRSVEQEAAERIERQPF